MTAQASHLTRLAELPWGLGECRCARSFGHPQPKCEPAPQELTLQAHETETPLYGADSVYLSVEDFFCLFFFSFNF